MFKNKKNFATCVNRISLIGDTVVSLAVLGYMRKLYPDCYNTLSIAKKCSQSIPLFVQHPFIDKIHVNEFLENPKQEEYNFLKSHDIWASPTINHKISDWQNYYSIYEENFEMLGIDSKKLPKENLDVNLVKWFDIKQRENKTVALFPFAGYAKDNKRSCSINWWIEFIKRLIKEDYIVIHLGHFDEPSFYYLSSEIARSNKYFNFTSEEFFNQIKTALSCSVSLNSDSGTGLIMGAYSFPQVTLLTNWNLGHNRNFLSLQPNNKNNISIFREDSCDNIEYDQVVEAIKLLV